MRSLLRSAVAGLALLSASQASAALTLVENGACNPATPTPDALGCAGAYSGNLNNNARVTDLNLAIDALMGRDYPDVDWAALDQTKNFFSAGLGTTVEFAEALFGQQILSVHFGNAGSGLGNRTILYLFDFGAGGASSVDLGTRGFSNAVLIPAVPEPSTWAMMLLGFGAMGVALRRGRRTGKLAQIA